MMLHFLIKSQQLKNKVLIKSQRHRSPLGKQRWPRNNTHRLLFERSSCTFSTVKGFGRDKQFMTPEVIQTVPCAQVILFMSLRAYANFVVSVVFEIKQDKAGYQ